eukprot:jgi/Ulvmu1/8188/UM040_0085.1
MALSVEDGIVAFSLVQDLLTNLGCVCSSRLFAKEARLHHPMTRQELNDRLGLDPQLTGQGTPLLLTLLSSSKSMTGRPVDEADVSASPGECTKSSHGADDLVCKEREHLMSTSVDDEADSTPTRIPSFTGTSATPANPLLQVAVTSPEQTSAPYTLPSDSGDSGDSMRSGTGSACGQDWNQCGPTDPLVPDGNSVQPMDVEETVAEQGNRSHDPQLHEEVHEAAVKPAVLSPLPRNNLPPLTPISGMHRGSGVGSISSLDRASGEGAGPVAPPARDVGMEGRELLELLGSPRESEPDELPGLRGVGADPDMYSEDGDIAGLELLLPDSSSESDAEPIVHV